MRGKVTRANAKVLRYEDVWEVWHTQNELIAKLTEMTGYQDNDDGESQTMVQDRAAKRQS